MNTYLFDFDGTLVDSMPDYCGAMLRILDENGVSYEPDIVKVITPLGVSGTADHFISMGVKLPKEEIVRRMGMYLIEAYTYRIPAKAHVPEVLQLLKSRGCSLNVLTASPHITLDPCLKRLGLYDIFDNVWSCDDFGTTKANPEIYKMAAQRIGVPVEQVLFLDDNLNADRSAREAGMPVCGVFDESSAEYTGQMKAENDYYIYDFLELPALGSPVLSELIDKKETCWKNEKYAPAAGAIQNCALTYADMEDASRRLQRFAPYFRVAFPETVPTGGIIESQLRPIPQMQKALEETYGLKIPGSVFLKLDSHLPVAGSVKARGGVYEVLKLAEDIAIKSGMLSYEDDYSVLAKEAFRKLFSGYSIAVGSTGNLGLSIGIMSAKLGFRVTVHMSADARAWKKDMLRSKGVCVKEYESDYSEAVRLGRIEAEKDPKCHFVDDENSQTLFLGYSVAALRLKEQLKQQNIPVDDAHPLMVYLPCGVGGAPGGIAFGLKQVFGDHVHCFFAEPVDAPCMTLGMATGLHNAVSVQDIGIEGRTIADGLAVGRASGFVGRLMEPFLAGCYTVTDARMQALLVQLADCERIKLEPSALAGMYGPVLAGRESAFADIANMQNATHIVWATGGGMVPPEEMKKYYPG